MYFEWRPDKNTQVGSYTIKVAPHVYVGYPFKSTGAGKIFVDE